MMPNWLRRGSKGKLVKTLQELLNEWGKLPKKIDEDGDYAKGTREAVIFFQKKARIKDDEDGEVGPATAAALVKLVGGSKATSFAKEIGEGEPDAAGAATTGDDDEAGDAGKVGNVLHDVGDYVLSIPPNPEGSFPCLALFAGNTGKRVMLNQTPRSYYKKAILVFGERDGKFSGFESKLKELLKKTKTSISFTNVCGYSSGGGAAFENYGKADKRVGFIDPTVYSQYVDTINSKAIFSMFPNPDAWSFKAGADTAANNRQAAYERTEKVGGIVQLTTVSHGMYPKYFLKCFESKLI